MLSERQIRERLFKLKEEIKIYEGILEGSSDGVTGRPKGSSEYSEEEIQFLRTYRNLSMKDLIKLFNDKFGYNYPEDSRALYNLMERQGILKPVWRSPTVKQLIPSEENDEIQKDKPQRRGYVRKEGVRYGGRMATRKWCDTKEKVLAILKIHYFGSYLDKANFTNENKIEWSEVVKSIYGLRKRFNIIPEEIGLKEFPTRNERIKILVE